MSTAVFQTALARLIIDPAFRDRVRRLGDRASPPALTPRERRRLVGVARSAGLEITRTLHKGFRLNKILGRLPLTCTLLTPSVLAREIDRFWERRLPTSFYYLEEAIAFSAYLLDRPGGAFDVPYLDEVVRYERAGLLLQTPRCPDDAPVSSETVVFDHDPVALLSALGCGATPTSIPRSPCLLVGSVDDQGAVRWRVTPRGVRPAPPMKVAVVTAPIGPETS